MEGRSNNKRANEPKHLRRKVVFVDPDDPKAPHWWPALVVPLKEIEIFKQRMDCDVQYPAEGENVVCYFEDGSFSNVSEKDQLPFDPKGPPYTTYMEGPNASIFQRDKAVALATQYYEKGVIPQSFKWLHREDSSTSIGTGFSVNGDINMNESEYVNGEEDHKIYESRTSGNTKRHSRKDSTNNAIDNASFNKKDGQANTKKDNGGTTQRKNSISGPSRKNSGPLTGNSTSRATKTKQSKTSGHIRQLSTNSTTTKLSSINQSTNNYSSSMQQSKSMNNSASASVSTSLGTSNSAMMTERATTTSRVKTCSQCGEKASSARATVSASSAEQSHAQSHSVLCGECGELMNSLIIKDGNVVMENDNYFKHFVEKKRRQPERFWNIKDVEKVEMSILYGKLPISKRQKWLDRSEDIMELSKQFGD
ncbi:hypothetical protein RclHR1_05350006 [Rhizophagus clarus]|uniref:PWWP domain-containing protein n=1 Tax=Rhizophagus clarus TaxID=94130 RepID=A0A2Z6S568_9GLOM|nr:hypothetical protein RclHR1_05350006 [Rhizophagus clarus]GES90433.1 hypothetical protein GLOIN_2v1605214 [Rhizophagus clarus]